MLLSLFMFLVAMLLVALFSTLFGLSTREYLITSFLTCTFIAVLNWMSVVVGNQDHLCTALVFNVGQFMYICLMIFED